MKVYKFIDAINKMRRWSFIFAIVGLLILLLLLHAGKQTEINDYEGLEKLEINSKVFTSGNVVSEKIIFEKEKILVLDNGLELICFCKEKFQDKMIHAEGIVSEYEGTKQLNVLKIFAEDD